MKKNPEPRSNAGSEIKMQIDFSQSANSSHRKNKNRTEYDINENKFSELEKEDDKLTFRILDGEPANSLLSSKEVKLKHVN